ncbi:MAG: hypothetical protein ACFE9T_13520, partial [Promethearchaeota archaeon]
MGSRYELFYSIYSIFYEYTKIPLSYLTLSKLIYPEVQSFGGRQTKIMTLLRYDPSKSDLNEMWKLEYGITKLKPNPDLGFDVDYDTIKKIQEDCIKLIRTRIINELVSERVSPTLFNAIWESLYALSGDIAVDIFWLRGEIVGWYRPNKDYLTGILKTGETPHSGIIKSLFKFLIKEGIESDHMAVQWTKRWLETKDLDSIDFKLYFEEINIPLSQLSGKSDHSTLTPNQKKLAREILYGLSCGRSWLTGDPIDLDDALVHHIRHNQFGDTLYGGFYDTLKNLAVIAGRAENLLVEGPYSGQWEDKLIKTWERLSRYHIDGIPPDHWSDENKVAFMKERHS